MKRLLVALCVVAPFATAYSGMDGQADPVRLDAAKPERRFEIVQDGRLVEEINGVVDLEHGAFGILYVGDGSPSVFATTDPYVMAQCHRLDRGIVSFPGFGSAQAPFNLDIVDDALEMYAGWNPEFEAKVGRVFGPESKASYLKYRESERCDPFILTTSRHYANFFGLADGSQLYVVLQLDSESVDASHIEILYLGLFDHPDTEATRTTFNVMALRVEPLIIRFDRAD